MKNERQKIFLNIFYKYDAIRFTMFNYDARVKLREKLCETIEYPLDRVKWLICLGITKEDEKR